MAYTRKEEFVLDLSGVVQNALKAFDVQRTKIQSEKEAIFSRKVAEDGMSYESQLDYREKQLARERDKTYPDPDYISDLESSVAGLKRMVRFEDIRNKYRTAYTDWATGKGSINNLIGVLENQLAVTSNPEMREELNKQLQQARVDKANAEMTILDNRVKLAKADGSIDLIDKTIGDLEKRRNDALIAGDEQTISYLDVKIQSLKSQKTKIQTEDKIIDFDLKAVQQNLSSVEKLQMLEDELANADDAETININGTTWDSEKDFWTYQKSNYLAGTGSGSFKDFFGEHSEEMQTRVAKASARNNYGYVPNSIIQGVENSYDDLNKMSALEGYEDKVETYKLSDVSNAVDKSATAVIGETQDTGTWEAGFQALNSLESMFGLDTSAYISDLSYKSITTTPSRAQAIKQTAQALAEENETSVREEARNLYEMLEGAQEDEEEPVVEMAQTPAPAEEPEEPQPTPGPQPAPESETALEPQTTSKPEMLDYEIEYGDTLSDIAQEYDSSVSRLMELNKEKIKDPNEIYEGDIIKVPKI